MPPKQPIPTTKLLNAIVKRLNKKYEISFNDKDIEIVNLNKP